MDNKKLAVAIVAILAVIAIATACIVAFGNNDERTVTLDQNYDGGNVTEMKVKNGEEIMAPTSVRLGHYFVGWYLDKECTKEASFPYKVTGDVRFYARWSEHAAASLFNEDYLTDTATGKALYNKSQITQGSAIAKIDGKEFNALVKAVGDSYVIADLDTKDDKLSVISLSDFSVMFKITYNEKSLVQIKTVGLTASNTEYFVVQCYSGYCVYDLNGNSTGTCTSEPEQILADTILFNGTFYKFDSNGSIYGAFDVTKNTHIPAGGNGDTYYEIERMETFNDTYDCALNILNDKYEVIKTLKFADKAKLATCVTLPAGGYVVQYGVAGTSSEKYMITKDGTSYFLTTYLIDKDLNVEEITLKRLIERSYDRSNAPYIDWDMYSHDTVSIAYVQKTTSLGEDTEMVVFASNGKLVKVLNRLSTFYCTTVIPMSTPGYNIGLIQTMRSEYAVADIFDGTGRIYNVPLTDIQNINGTTYFVKKAYNTETKTLDESKRTDFNIYNINGTVLGNFAGYTYIGSSHNDLFFEKDGDTYVYRNAAMSKLCDGTDVTIYDWGYSYAVEVGTKTTYMFCTENGSVISTSVSESCTTYLTNNGEYVINIVIEKGEYRLFKLTA